MPTIYLDNKELDLIIRFLHKTSLSEKDNEILDKITSYLESIQEADKTSKPAWISDPSQEQIFEILDSSPESESPIQTKESTS